MTDVEPPEKYLRQRYAAAIAYYWRVAQMNKRAYKWSRYLTIFLGSAVTLVASLSSAEFSKQHATLFGILTPCLAALLTMLSAFAQSFQWGASWREMVLVAERLENERDRIAVTPDAELKPAQDLQLLNSLIIQESSGFFDRVMGSSSPHTPDNQQPRQTPPPAPA